MIHHHNQLPYIHFMSRAIIDRSINNLIGLLNGINIDQKINESELIFLRNWLNEHQTLSQRYPFTEILPKLLTAIEDSIFTQDEYDDVIWVCNQLNQGKYFDRVSIDLQKLHGIVGGVASDGNVNDFELRGLSDWLYENQHLKSLWPYDEIESLITGVLSDKTI